jgi:hypothetical protein
MTSARDRPRSRLSIDEADLVTDHDRGKPLGPFARAMDVIYSF